MAAKRKASGQSLKALSFEGERDRGSANAIGRRLRPGCHATGGSGGTKAPSTEAATAPGSSSGPKWPIPGSTTVLDEPRPWENASRKSGPNPSVLAPQAKVTGHRTSARWAKASWENEWAKTWDSCSRRHRRRMPPPSSGGESVVDVGGECRWIDPVEGGLAGEVGERLTARAEHLAPPEGPGRQGVALEERSQGLVFGVDDRLEAVQRGEGAGSSFLGQKNGGAPTRMAEPVGTFETELVDDGEHVGGEAVPVEVSIRGRVRGAMGALVESDAMELPPQVLGHGGEHGAAEPGGMGEKERRPVSTEVVVRDAESVRRGDPTGGRHGPEGIMMWREVLVLGHPGGRYRVPTRGRSPGRIRPDGLTPLSEPSRQGVCNTGAPHLTPGSRGPSAADGRGVTSQRLAWRGGLLFEGEDSGGHRVAISGDATREGVKPSDLLPLSLAACLSYDVVEVLRKKRQDLRSMEVTVSSEQEDAAPWRFVRVVLRFEVGGVVDISAARRALELAEKNCPVLATVTPTVRVVTSIEVTAPLVIAPHSRVVPGVRVAFTFRLPGVHF